MPYFIACLLLILSYIIGSIPFGFLISKHKGVDIRTQGSGNIGTTNTLRVLGKKYGVITGVLDVFKGMFVIIIIKILEFTNIWYNPFTINNDSLYALYGLAAVLGHVFPIFLKFKGGKAVATSFGALMILAPISSIFVILTFFILVAVTGYVVLGSTIGALVALPISFIFYRENFYSNLILIIMVIIIVIRHSSNFKRLAQGTERCFRKHK